MKSLSQDKQMETSYIPVYLGKWDKLETSGHCLFPTLIQAIVAIL